MPYSKSLGLIFVAIPKTGTTSVSHALKDISDRNGEELRLLKEYVDDDFRSRHRLDEIGDKKPGRTKHLSALQLKYILGEQEFARCFKFTLVRNPWARIVSRYFFTHRQSEPSEEEKVRRGTTRKFHDKEFEVWVRDRWKKFRSRGKGNDQLDKLTDLDGQLIVDHVGRLENVQACLDIVCDRLGVDRIEVPHVNGTKHKRYIDYYTDETRDMVAEMCRRDIEYFGYSFDQ